MLRIWTTARFENSSGALPICIRSSRHRVDLDRRLIICMSCTTFRNRSHSTLDRDAGIASPRWSTTLRSCALRHTAALLLCPVPRPVTRLWPYTRSTELWVPNCKNLHRHTIEATNTAPLRKEANTLENQLILETFCPSKPNVLEVRANADTHNTNMPSKPTLLSVRQPFAEPCRSRPRGQCHFMVLPGLAGNDYAICIGVRA